MHIVETSFSNYAFHLSETGNTGAPTLCGITNTMHTNFPLRTWNSEPDHIRSKYCGKCDKLSRELGLSFPVATEKTLVLK